jgi:N6-L-threonylcarbamoyladenine synthase
VVGLQTEQHAPFGGVVPEIAARAHVEAIDGVAAEAMSRAGIRWEEVSGVAATAGPGLIGGVMVGLAFGKAVALARGLPLVAVNHLEGHAVSARLGARIDYPFLLLLVSGGHCQLLRVDGIGACTRLGSTIDDAAGEAFDKIAKSLGLPYPGGPALERLAASGDPGAFDLPRALLGRPGCDFSFSGLKTALRQTIEALPPNELDDGMPTHPIVAAIAGAFQDAVADVMADRASHALDMFLHRHPDAATGNLVIAGGVAANGALRARLATLADKRRVRLVAPPLALCTDNAAMIAWAGVERLRLGLTDPLDFAPRPRWPLDPTAPRAIGAGVKA